MDARPPGIWRLAAQPESDSISVEGAVVIFGLKVQQRFGPLKNHKWFFSIRGRCRQGTQAHRARAFASASTVSKDGDFKLGKSIGVSFGPSANEVFKPDAASARRFGRRRDTEVGSGG